MYLQFGNNVPKTVTVVLEEAKAVTVNVRIDSYRGRVVSTAVFDGAKTAVTATLTTGVIGKHAVYFEFVSPDANESYTFDRFTFD